MEEDSSASVHFRPHSRRLEGLFSNRLTLEVKSTADAKLSALHPHAHTHAHADTQSCAPCLPADCGYCISVSGSSSSDGPVIGR